MPSPPCGLRRASRDLELILVLIAFYLRCYHGHVDHGVPHVTPAMPHVTAAAPHVTPATPHVTAAAPHVTLATPHVTAAAPHVTPATPHVTVAAPHVTAATPHVTAAAPHVTAADARLDELIGLPETSTWFSALTSAHTYTSILTRTAMLVLVPTPHTLTFLLMLLPGLRRAWETSL